jgi:predicted DNA-binding transcriptional regulator YafY
MPSPDYEVTLNILAMLRLLERSGRKAVRVRDLAERLDVHPRTVKRWVDALQTAVEDHAGEPLVRRERRQGEAWIALSRSRDDLVGTVFQYAAAHAAWQALAGRQGSLLSDAAADLVERAEEALPPSTAALVARVPQAFHYAPFAPKDYRGQEEVLDLAIQAVLRRQALEVHYRSAQGRESHWTLEPWSLVLHRESFYLLARAPWLEEGALWTFAIDRIQDATLRRDRPFEVPADFDPDAHLSGGLGIWDVGREPEAVRVAFVEGITPGVRERVWPGFEGWSTHGDGRPVLSLSLPVTPELVTWVLAYGAAAEALSPPSLRDQVRTELERAFARYSAD